MIKNTQTMYNALAASYDAFRPHYPPESLGFLVTLADLDRTNTVADIGAGTGQLSLALAQYSRLVYAVDTASAMLERLQENAREQSITNIVTVDAEGENTKLPSESLDLVVLAQVFHWMNKQNALKEMHRLLKPRKPLAIIWNQSLSEGERYTLELKALVSQFNPNYVSKVDIDSADFVSEIEKSGFFTPPEIFEFPYLLEYSLEDYLGYLMSKSYVGAGIPASHTSEFMVAAYEVLLRAFPHGKVVEKHETVMLAARKR